MTTRPKHLLPDLGAVSVDADEEHAWNDADLPKGACDEWRGVFRRHYGRGAPGELTWPARAERLHNYGWTPVDFDEALATRGQFLQIPHIGPGRLVSGREVDMTEEQMEAGAALSLEVVLLLDFQRFAANYARERYMQALAEHGWTNPQLGSLFDLSKQRVQQILKRISAPGGKRVARSTRA